MEKVRKRLIAIYLTLGALAVFVLGAAAWSFNQPAKIAYQSNDLLFDSFNSYPTGQKITKGGKWEDLSSTLNLQLKSNWFYMLGKVYHEPYIPADYTSDPEHFRGSLLLAGEVSWANYVLFLHLESVDGSGVGAIFRYQDPDNYYRVILTGNQPGGPYLELDKKINGQLAKLGQAKVSWGAGSWHRLKIIADGSNFEVLLDGQSVLKVEDSSFLQGKIGLFAWEHSGAFFDDVLVTKLGN